MDEKLQDRIDEYILGRMSAEDRRTFESDLKKDKTLRVQYNFTKIVQKTISEQAQLRQNMYDWDKEIEKERIDVACCARPAACAEPAAIPEMRRADVATPKPRRRIWLWVSGIAAILVVGMFMVNPFSTSESDFQYESISVGSAARDGGDLGEIDKLITNKQYGKALTMIEEAEKELQEASNQEGFDKDSSIYGVEDRERIEYEKRELQQRKDDLAWMKANVLIGLGRKSEALIILQSLSNVDGEYKGKAEALFNQLKN